MSPVAVVNHVGLCVSDLARSRRFYEELFGFEMWREFPVPDAFTAPLLQLEPPVGTTACYLRCGSFVLELLHHADPSQRREPTERRFNDPGLTHLSISCDIADVCARAPGLGGEVLRDTDLGSAVFIRDPDGQRVELLPSSYAQEVAGS